MISHVACFAAGSGSAARQWAARSAPVELLSAAASMAISASPAAPSTTRRRSTAQRNSASTFSPAGTSRPSNH